MAADCSVLAVLMNYMIFLVDRQLELTSCNCDHASLIEWAKHRRGIKCWNGQQYIYVVDMDCTTGSAHHIEHSNH